MELAKDILRILGIPNLMAEGLVKENESEGIVEVGRRSEYYREIVPTSIWGGVRPGYIETIAISSKTNAIEAMINGKTVIEHTEEICLKLTPQQTKSLIRWLLSQLKHYESLYGKTKTSEEVDMSTKPPEEVPYSRIDEILNEL